MKSVSKRGAGYGVAATFVAVLVFGQVVNADEAGKHLAAPFGEMTWQTAEVTDMALFEPFIGKFTSDDKVFPNGTEYRFIIDYSWYDNKKTIVKYTLEIEFPAQEDIRPIGEGYYRFDPLSRRIEVVGVFRDGRSGCWLHDAVRRRDRFRGGSYPYPVAGWRRGRGARHVLGHRSGHLG